MPGYSGEGQKRRPIQPDEVAGAQVGFAWPTSFVSVRRKAPSPVGLRMALVVLFD